MQKTFLTSAILSLAFIFTQSAYATLPPKPDKCPNATAIASVGIQVVEKDDDGYWFAGVPSNTYNTNNVWTFAVGKIIANDGNNARQKALDALKSIQFNRGPVVVPQYDVWACVYNTDEGYIGVTVTPPFSVKKAAKMVK